MGYVKSGVRGLTSGKGATNVPYIEQGIMLFLFIYGNCVTKYNEW